MLTFLFSFFAPSCPRSFHTLLSLSTLTSSLLATLLHAHAAKSLKLKEKCLSSSSPTTPTQNLIISTTAPLSTRLRRRKPPSIAIASRTTYRIFFAVSPTPSLCRRRLPLPLLFLLLLLLLLLPPPPPVISPPRKLWSESGTILWRSAEASRTLSSTFPGTESSPESPSSLLSCCSWSMINNGATVTMRYLEPRKILFILWRRFLRGLSVGPNSPYCSIMVLEFCFDNHMSYLLFVLIMILYFLNWILSI